jgi:hypothetical protein
MRVEPGRGEACPAQAVGSPTGGRTQRAGPASPTWPSDRLPANTRPRVWGPHLHLKAARQVPALRLLVPRVHVQCGCSDGGVVRSRRDRAPQQLRAWRAAGFDLVLAPAVESTTRLCSRSRGQSPRLPAQCRAAAVRRRRTYAQAAVRRQHAQRNDVQPRRAPGLQVTQRGRWPPPGHGTGGRCQHTETRARRKGPSWAPLPSPPR